MLVGVVVQPNQQASFEYIFKPDQSLEPTEFWLTADVIYNSSVVTRKPVARAGFDVQPWLGFIYL